MAEERRAYAEQNCRDCQCSEHNVMTALAERKDAWDIANRALTDAVKGWPPGGDGDNVIPPTVDAADVLLFANWLYFGEASVGT